MFFVIFSILLLSIKANSDPPRLTNSRCGNLKMIPFSSLSSAEQTAATSLKYNSTTWPQLHTNSLEKESFNALTSEQRSFASSLLYPGECWDCKVNHYEGFNWYAMSDVVKQSWGILGWNQSNWELGATFPPSESKHWIDLSPDEQLAAQDLCYNESIWNQ
jgi:hypothetical protein